MESYNSQVHIKIDWSEMDLFGHVNNVSYFKYVQAARVAYCGRVGINTHMPEDKLSFAVAASSCKFKKPLFYPGDIVVKTKVTWVKNSSFQLEHIIVDRDGTIAAEAEDVLVIFDYEKQSKVTVPSNVRALITEVEKRPFN
ncbi:MAG: hypothetical protein JWO32_1533 [Bacteroidetes bacterium]|nr:hypothetical protein [Bacteroidota bacterium]